MFTHDPTVLSGLVRNIIIGRAAAGLYDVHETDAQAIRACRAAARQRLGRQRLSSAQAAECDALCMAVRSRTMAIDAPAAMAMAQPSAETSAIVAALARIERLLMAIVAILVRRTAREPAEMTVPETMALPSAPSAMVTWQAPEMARGSN